MAKKKKDYRYWKAGARYGYGAIDEYDLDGNMTRNVIAGITQKDARSIAIEHNSAMNRVATKRAKAKLKKLWWY